MKLQTVSFFLAGMLNRISAKIYNSPLFAVGIIFCFLLFFVLLCYLLFNFARKLGQNEARQELELLIKEGRKDAVKRSRAVLSGQMAEQIAPFLHGFPCNPSDVRFVGKPLDFIGFPGAADGSGIKEILFIEVKTGNSSLSAREREIKEAVQAGRVRYVEYNPEIDFSEK